jgi:hypothetical protein
LRAKAGENGGGRFEDESRGIFHLGDLDNAANDPPRKKDPLKEGFLAGSIQEYGGCHDGRDRNWMPAVDFCI